MEMPAAAGRDQLERPSLERTQARRGRTRRTEDRATGSPAIRPDTAPRAETQGADFSAWPLDERPGFLARRMHQIHVSLFSERCAAFRVTPLQYSLLSLLRGLGEADQTTLANAVALDRTTTTGALKRLAARGLVSRSTSTADRRARSCRITPEGEALHAAMEASAFEAHARTVAALDPAERDLLIRLMRRIVEDNGDRRGDARID